MRNRYMPLGEFVNSGYLQEVNRRFLHPLGLSLELRRTDGGEMEVAGVVDHRDSPVGMLFNVPAAELHQKAGPVIAREAEMRVRRMDGLGYYVQPIGGPDREEAEWRATWEGDR